MIAGGAAQRAIAGLMSLALVSGGLVVPSVAKWLRQVLERNLQRK